MTFALDEVATPPPAEEPTAAPASPRYVFLSETRALVEPRPADEPVDSALRAIRTKIVVDGGGRLILARQVDDGTYVDLAYASTDGWRGPGTKGRTPPHKPLPPRMPSPEHRRHPKPAH